MSWDTKSIAQFAPRPKSESKAKIWDGYVGALIEHGEELFAEFGIDTALELNHFMAQIAHESGGFTIVQESMHYRAERIMEIFGVGKHSAAVTEAEAEQLAGQPYELAERVYGIGNPKKAKELGNVEPGDGAKHIGLGYMQITGRTDHEKYFAGDYSPRQMLKAALMEWDEKNCNDHACKDDVKKITKLINGGFNGLADRQKCLAKAKKIWPVFPFESEGAKAEVKPAVKSETVQLAATTLLATLTAGAGAVVDTAKAAGLTDSSPYWRYVVFAGLAMALVTAIGTVLHRAKKPDISGWFR